MARAAYLRKVIDVAQTAEAEGLQDGTSHFLVRAKMSTLQKHFDRAEQILLEQGAIDQAMEMYQELHRCVSDSRGLKLLVYEPLSDGDVPGAPQVP